MSKLYTIRGGRKIHDTRNASSHLDLGERGAGFGLLFGIYVSIYLSALLSLAIFIFSEKECDVQQNQKEALR
jgi:hypothetical protein